MVFQFWKICVSLRSPIWNGIPIFFCIFLHFFVPKVPKKVPKNIFLTLKSTKNYTEYQKYQKVPKYPKIPELPKSTKITQKYPNRPLKTYNLPTNKEV